MAEKTVSASGGLSLPVILTLIFLVLKLCGVIAWSWLWVFSPLWIFVGILVAIILVAVAVAVVKDVSKR